MRGRRGDTWKNFREVCSGERSSVCSSVSSSEASNEEALMATKATSALAGQCQVVVIDDLGPIAGEMSALPCPTKRRPYKFLDCLSNQRHHESSRRRRQTICP
jgi:hypothetical protein